jgi:hypothetical protein
MIKFLLVAILLTAAQAARAQSSSYLDQELQQVEVANADPISVDIGTATITATAEFDLVSVSIVTAGGTGTAVFSSTGTITHCGLVPPSAAASFDFEIVTNDADEFPIFGNIRRLVGRTGLAGERILLGSHKATFSNCSPDGTYKAKCTIRR